MLRSKALEIFIRGGGNDYLKKILRDYPFEFPEGFVSWRVLSALYALSVEALGSNADEACKKFALHSLLVLSQGFPCYCVDENLLKLLVSSRISSWEGLIADLISHYPVPNLCLLFPRGIVTHEGADVDFVNVHFYKRSLLHETSSCEWSNKKIIAVPAHFNESVEISSTDSRGITWFKAVAHESGNLYGLDGEGLPDLGELVCNSADSQFMRFLMGVCVQALLHFVYCQKEVVYAASSGRGFGLNSSRKAERIRRPIWIREEKRVYERSPSSLNSSRKNAASCKAPHHRSAHWRRVTKGREEPTWVWVRDSYVNRETTFE